MNPPGNPISLNHPGPQGSLLVGPELIYLLNYYPVTLTGDVVGSGVATTNELLLNTTLAHPGLPIGTTTAVGSVLQIPVLTTASGVILQASQYYHSGSDALNPRNPLPASGAIGTVLGGFFDGNSHPVSNFIPGTWANLAAVGAAYPNVFVNQSSELDRIVLQNAANVAGNANYANRVYVPGPFCLDAPVLVNKESIEIYGSNDQKSGAVASPLVAGSIGFFVAPSSYGSIPLGAALASGNGGSYTLIPGGKKWLNFSDLGLLNNVLNITNKFTLEFYLKFNTLPSNTSGFRNIIRCQGTLNNYSGSNGLVPFGMGILNGNTMVIESTTGGVYNLYQCNLGNLTNISKGHFVALDLYNSVLAFSVDGVVQSPTLGSSTVNSGNLTLAPWLDFVVGVCPTNWPDYGILFDTVDAQIDSIRLTAVSRYDNLNFTPPNPPTKLTWSASSPTLLCNFDNVYGPLCGAYVRGGGLSWMWHRDRSATSANIEHVHLHDLNLNPGGPGISIVHSPNTKVDKITVPTSPSFGVQFWYACFSCTASNIDLTGTTAGLCLSDGTVNFILNGKNKLNTNFFGVGLVDVGGGGNSFNHIYVLDNLADAYLLGVGTSTDTLNDFYVDSEAPGRQCSIYLNGGATSIVNSNIFYGFGTDAAICVYGANYLSLKSTTVTGSVGPTYAINVQSAPGNPIHISPDCQLGGLTSWCNNMDYVALDGIRGTPLVHLPDASGVNINLNAGCDFLLSTTTAAGSGRTLNLSNPTLGQEFTLTIQQPPSGTPVNVTSWFPGYNVRFKGGTTPNLTAGSGVLDLFDCKVYDYNTITVVSDLGY